MVKIKKVVVAIAAGVLTMSLGIGTALAATAGDPDAKDAKKTIAQNEPSREDLEKKAIAAGVNPAGLTDEQLQRAIKETVVDVQVDPNEPVPHDELVSIAHEVGIDITGMTDSQIEAALRDYKLKQVAAGQNVAPSREELENKAVAVGVNPAGLTDEQLQRAIKETVVEEDSEPNEPLLHDKLVKIANDVGIDITGMTDAQIEQALRAEKAKNSR